MRFIVQGFRALAVLLFAVLASPPLDAAPWIETSSFFHSAGAASNYFGRAVALDGDVAVVGQPFTGPGTNPSGSAFVFVRSGGSWSQAATLVPDVSTPNDEFGWSVAISGDTVVVGSPNRTALDIAQEGLSFVYVRPAGGWSGTVSPSAILEGLAANGLSDRFGISVAVSGGMVAVGAATAVGPFGRSGHVFAYEKPAPGWSGTLQPSGDLISSDGADGDELGYSVAISGNTVVGGAPFAENSFLTAAGKAYVWVRPAGGWIPKLNGQAAELLPSDPVSAGNFGSAVSLDGTTAAVTSPYFNSSDPTLHEKGYVFVQPGAGWSGTLNEDAQLQGADVTNSFLFGQSVSISGDTVAIGAPFADTYFTASEGAAYVFDRPSTGWSGSLGPFAKVYRGSGPAADAFGYAVAISGTTLISGAPGETIGGNPSQGAVHVFEPGASPTATASFAPGSVYTFQPSTLSLSVTNPNTTGFLSNLAFAAAPSTPSGLSIDAVPNASTTCGGILLLGSPQFLVGTFKGNLPAGSSCGLSINVSSNLPDTYTTGILPSLNYIPFFCDQGCWGVTSNTASLLVRLHPTQVRVLVQGPIRVAPGVPVEFPFEVSARRSEIEPTGEVVVSDGEGHSCRAEVSTPGTAGGGSCSLTFPAAGNYRVRAEYLGNLSFAASSSPAKPVLVARP